MSLWVPEGSGRPFAWCVPQVRDALQGRVNPWEEAEIPDRAKVGTGWKGLMGSYSRPRQRTAITSVSCQDARSRSSQCSGHGENSLGPLDAESTLLGSNLLGLESLGDSQR